MVHISGVKNCVADGLSRHPAADSRTNHIPEGIDEMDIVTRTLSIHQSTAITSVTLDRVRTETASDVTLNNLLQLIEMGIPEDKSKMPRDLH